jgi:cell division septal protein FtsQ
MKRPYHELNRVVVPFGCSATSSREKEHMGKVVMIAVALVVLVLVGGGVYLAFWDIPAPQTPVEKVIPSDRFPR